MPVAVEPLSVSISDVCFCHWPASPSVIDDLLPDWLEPDTTDGSAWVSAIPLRMDRFDAFGLPLREGIEAVNLRTYVNAPGGDRGVYFLSLDVTDRLAAETARTLFRLPYYHASIDRLRDGERTEVTALRRDRSGSRLTVTFEPSGEPGATTPDTMASFLIERERYYATGPFGTRLVGSVGHDPWSVQPASATVTESTLITASGIESDSTDPLAHYSPGVEMSIGPLHPL